MEAASLSTSVYDKMRMIFLTNLKQQAHQYFLGLWDLNLYHTSCNYMYKYEVNSRNIQILLTSGPYIGLNNNFFLVYNLRKCVLMVW